MVGIRSLCLCIRVPLIGVGVRACSLFLCARLCVCARVGVRIGVGLCIDVGIGVGVRFGGGIRFGVCGVRVVVGVCGRPIRSAG